MSPVITVARREMRSTFDQPTGYVLLVAFVAVNAFLFFRSAYLSNVASLRPMLEFLPWRDWQKSLLALAAGTALVAGGAFLMNLV